MVVCTLVLRRVTYSSSAAPALESDPLFLPSFEFLASMDGKRPKGATRLIEWHQTLLLVQYDLQYDLKKNKKRQNNYNKLLLLKEGKTERALLET